MQFAQNLRDILTDSDTTPYRLAKDIGVHQTTVRNWLEEKTSPSGEVIARVANYFGLPVSYLIEDHSIHQLHGFKPTPALYLVRSMIGTFLSDQYPKFVTLGENPCTCLELTIKDKGTLIIRDLGSLCDGSDFNDFQLAIYMYRPNEEPNLDDNAVHFNAIRFALRPFLARAIHEQLERGFTSKTETRKKTLKKPAAHEDDELTQQIPNDPETAKVLELFRQLSPENRKLALAQLDLLINFQDKE